MVEGDLDTQEVFGYKTYIIETFTAGGKTFETVELKFDSQEQSGLFAVELHAITKDSSHSAPPKQLIHALTRKYGKPDQTEKESRPKKWFWYFPSTLIKASYWAEGSRTGVHVKYKKSADTDGL